MQVQCPNCLRQKKQNTIVKRGNYYFCQDLKCDLIEDDASYNVLLENYRNEQITHDKIICDQSLIKCPSCAILGENRRIVKRGNQYLCENSACVFIESEEDTIEKNIENNLDIAWKSFENTCDLILNENISEKADTMSIKDESTVFNWFKLPSDIEFHNKIICAMIIHLNIFDNQYCQCIEDIKEEYTICKTAFNDFKDEKVSIFSFCFFSKLSNIINNIPKSIFIENNNNIDEILFLSLNNFCNTFDTVDISIIDYRVTVLCSTCGNYEITDKKTNFIEIESHRSDFKISNNEISFKINCLHCSGLSVKSILLQTVPQNLIFRYCNGTMEDLSLFEENLFNDKGNMSIVGVVEYDDKYNHSNCFNIQMSLEEYKSLIVDNKTEHKYKVHFREKGGWYTLQNEGDIISCPSQTLQIDNLSDIQMIILGLNSDSNMYNVNISSNEYLDKLQLISERSDFLSQNDFPTNVDFHKSNLTKRTLSFDNLDNNEKYNDDNNKYISEECSVVKKFRQEEEWDIFLQDEEEVKSNRDIFISNKYITNNFKSNLYENINITRKSSMTSSGVFSYPSTYNTSIPSHNCSNATSNIISKESFQSSVVKDRGFDLDELISLYRWKMKKKNPLSRSCDGTHNFQTSIDGDYILNDSSKRIHRRRR